MCTVSLVPHRYIVPVAPGAPVRLRLPGAVPAAFELESQKMVDAFADDANAATERATRTAKLRNFIVNNSTECEFSLVMGT
jgi:hypothetical protein